MPSQNTPPTNQQLLDQGVKAEVIAAVFTERLENFIGSFKESLIRIESKLDSHATMLINRDLEHERHKSEVDKRLSVLEDQAKTYRVGLRWVAGLMGAVGTGAVLSVLKTVFNW